MNLKRYHRYDDTFFVRECPIYGNYIIRKLLSAVSLNEKGYDDFLPFLKIGSSLEQSHAPTTISPRAIK